MAEVVGMSNLVSEGATEEEALQKIKATLEKTLSSGKFINIEIQEKEKIPQMKYAGIFADDQTFDDFMEKLKLIRQEANEATD
ncbi:type II toxin-antitoxin system HicB family antitoxin [Geminocystis herdmanii]|uniref:type II toxin-antitoxin system HicB family antitoxin n=1 Tax=Geminocystis herdmanii TaxID=669359 RepID=UPI00034AD51B|nr:type II toxin-antitoxin system HicB family antitoxin [Geminocystis herdmanii]